MGDARRRWYQNSSSSTRSGAEALRRPSRRDRDPDSHAALGGRRAHRARGRPDGRRLAGLPSGTRDDRVDPELAEALARRMIAFEGEYGSESPRLVEALPGCSELSPGARWAIDRVKLVLGSQARWDELFRIYDRAIEVAPDDARGPISSTRPRSPRRTSRRTARPRDRLPRVDPQPAAGRSRGRRGARASLREARPDGRPHPAPRRAAGPIRAFTIASCSHAWRALGGPRRRRIGHRHRRPHASGRESPSPT